MEFVPRLAIAWAINLAALWVANAIWDGVQIHGWAAYLIGSAVLGIANAVLKPLLAILTLPLILVTLGFFYLLINIAMVALAEWIAPNFSIDGFWTYVGTSSSSSGPSTGSAARSSATWNNVVVRA